MAGRIPPQFIDDLLQRVDIVEVINRRLPLKRAGKEYQARCPFHDEKTPSFTVSNEKQFYHCFGCGAHGSAIGFLMEYDHLEFVEAIEELAGMLGVEVPRESGGRQGPDLRPLYATLEQAAHYYQRQLREHPRAGDAVAYLKQRGLSGEIAASFGIGFAPPGWDNLLRALGRDETAIVRLREAGLISEPEGKRYDRLRNRIVFPIRDPRGRVIGFGGRVLNAEDSPKYLNSPETPLFHKGQELYGLYEARQALRRLDRLLVVEGYMDVLALAQFGIRNGVATLGTATTGEHLELIFRNCGEVVFCFDGDRAGRDAAWKALRTALPVMSEGREARFLFLPEGEDPDTLVRQEGEEAFNRRIEQAQPLSAFLFEQLASQVDMQTDEGAAHFGEQAISLLERLPKGIFRERMYQQLEMKLGMLRGSLQQARPTPSRVAQRPRRSDAQYRLPRPTPLRLVIAMLLDQPSLVRVIDETDATWRQWHSPGIPLLCELIEIIHTQPHINKAALLERWRGREAFVHLNRLADYRFDIPGLDQAAELRDALQKLNLQYLKEQALRPRNLRPSELSDEALEQLKRRFPGTGGEAKEPDG